ncbi:MAG TPA: MarR family winged helix-turn-helix transcriptional regulator [Chitinophaga sp.]|uniref:MarR family winged helix-turn-helix transcriptional regulator n=1 Tax=Chitinophaga sp. TaxID=1869181 RepID=UPI002BAAECF6|nr:MarR family winged helix-turn-helix transcriptional regulator [Chitinophaga sp.]HVI49537.1 MarR family winged helix-turn-helix transcriptional regulator [Chitinophaga sp.]
MSNAIDQIGILAIATRLQRLSELLRKDGLQIYKAHGIDFEPKWFPVIYTLHLNPIMSVVEIANEIGYTHPSTISLLKELEVLKLIKSKKDKTDTRKRMISLTEKGKKLVDEIKPVWGIIGSSLADLTDSPNNLMQAIIEVEERYRRKSLLDRALTQMEQ